MVSGERFEIGKYDSGTGLTETDRLTGKSGVTGGARRHEGLNERL